MTTAAAALAVVDVVSHHCRRPEPCSSKRSCCPHSKHSWASPSSSASCSVRSRSPTSTP